MKQNSCQYMEYPAQASCYCRNTSEVENINIYKEVHMAKSTTQDQGQWKVAVDIANSKNRVVRVYVYITGVFDLLYSAFHPMKYLEKLEAQLAESIVVCV